MHLIFASRNSASDEELICVDILISSGSFVEVNEPVIELEGAKAIFGIEAEINGFFYPLIGVGEKIAIGTLIGVISENTLSYSDLLTILNQTESTVSSVKTTDNSIQESFVTLPAQKLLKQKSISIEKIQDVVGKSTLIDTKVVEQYIKDHSPDQNKLSSNKWFEAIGNLSGLDSVILIGGGYGAIQVLDILLEQKDFYPIGFLSESNSAPVFTTGLEHLGEIDDHNLLKLKSKFNRVCFVNTIGSSPNFRVNFVKKAKDLDLNMLSLVHKSAYVSPTAEIGNGSVIFAQVHIGAEAKIGEQCFVSSNSTIEHHTEIGDGFCSGPNLNTSGLVKIGNGVRAGIGVNIEPSVSIGDNVTLSSGVIITSDIPSNSIVKTKFMNVVKTKQTF